MFKPIKKLNENAIKKDFFKGKKEGEIYKRLCIECQINDTIFLTTNNLNNITLPNIKQTIFVTTKNARSIVSFVENIKADELYLFCSRLNEKSFNIVKNNNLKGIGLSNRVLENNPELYKEVTKQVAVKLNTNHSKMLIFKVKENYYTITGSGNASINSRIENYIIENDKEKYTQIIDFFENA